MYTTLRDIDDVRFDEPDERLYEPVISDNTRLRSIDDIKRQFPWLFACFLVGVENLIVTMCFFFYYSGWTSRHIEYFMSFQFIILIIAIIIMFMLINYNEDNEHYLDYIVVIYLGNFRNDNFTLFIQIIIILSSQYI